MKESLITSVRDEIALRLGAGAGAVDVQDELIDPSGGPGENEEAALWPLTWSYRAGGRRHGDHELLGSMFG